MPIHRELPAVVLAEVEAKILKATHGRIRDLKVEDDKGCVTVRGSVPSHHTKQLVLQGMFECLTVGRFLAKISVRKQEDVQESSERLVKVS